MEQKVLGSAFVNRSGNGMQRTGQVEGTKGQENAKTVAGYSYSDPQATVAVECSIADGSRRVSVWMQEMEEEQKSVQDKGSQGSGTGQTNVTQEQNPSVEGEKAAQEEEKKKSSGGISQEDLDFMERLLDEMKKSREANAKDRNNGKKRSLNYNHRRVSAAIMRAKNSTQASNALTSAKSNLANLRRKMGSGKYDENELNIAISHANRMIRTARKKVKNVKMEEQRQRRDDGIENEAERRKNTAYKVDTTKDLAQNSDREREILLLKKELKQSQTRRKSAHRRDENHELLLADMEYLRRKIDLMRQEQQLQKEERSQAAELRQAMVSMGLEQVSSTAAAASGTAGVTSTDSGSTGSAGADAAAVPSGGFDAKA